MKKTRGRDCGTKRDALMRTAPKRKPKLERADPIAAKSLPACEVRQPYTFSKTIVRGRCPNCASSRINREKCQNVPDLVGVSLRSRPSPRYSPANERSWQGNDAHERSAVSRGRSFTVSF